MAATTQLYLKASKEGFGREQEILHYCAFISAAGCLRNPGSYERTYVKETVYSGLWCDGSSYSAIGNETLAVLSLKISYLLS